MPGAPVRAHRRQVASDRLGALAMNGTKPVRLAVGDVVDLAEADYCYGVGPVKLRLTVAVDLTGIPSLEWVAVQGVEIRPDGTDGAVRHVVARVSALP
jgi:hypothetical protein